MSGSVGAVPKALNLKGRRDSLSSSIIASTSSRYDFRPRGPRLVRTDCRVESSGTQIPPLPDKGLYRIQKYEPDQKKGNVGNIPVLRGAKGESKSKCKVDGELNRASTPCVSILRKNQKSREDKLTIFEKTNKITDGESSIFVSDFIVSTDSESINSLASLETDSWPDCNDRISQDDEISSTGATYGSAKESSDQEVSISSNQPDLKLSISVVDDIHKRRYSRARKAVDAVSHKESHLGSDEHVDSTVITASVDSLAHPRKLSFETGIEDEKLKDCLLAAANSYDGFSDDFFKIAQENIQKPKGFGQSLMDIDSVYLEAVKINEYKEWISTLGEVNGDKRGAKRGFRSYVGDESFIWMKPNSDSNPVVSSSTDLIETEEKTDSQNSESCTVAISTTNEKAADIDSAILEHKFESKLDLFDELIVVESRYSDLEDKLGLLRSTRTLEEQMLFLKEQADKANEADKEKETHSHQNSDDTVESGKCPQSGPPSVSKNKKVSKNLTEDKMNFENCLSTKAKLNEDGIVIAVRTERTFIPWAKRPFQKESADKNETYRQLVELILEIQAIYDDSEEFYFDAEKEWFQKNRVPDVCYNIAKEKADQLRDLLKIYDESWNNMMELVRGRKVAVKIHVAPPPFDKFWKLAAALSASYDAPKVIKINKTYLMKLKAELEKMKDRIDFLTALACPANLPIVTNYRFLFHRVIKRLLEDETDIIKNAQSISDSQSPETMKVC